MIKVLKAAEAAELLDCEVATLCERAACGDLPAVKVGRSWIFPAEALERRLNELATEQAERRRTPRHPASQGRRNPPSLS